MQVWCEELSWLVMEMMIRVAVGRKNGMLKRQRNARTHRNTLSVTCFVFTIMDSEFHEAVRSLHSKIVRVDLWMRELWAES